MGAADPRQRLFELIADFDDAMLVTCTAYGQLRARPMAMGRGTNGDGHLYFATEVDSPKVHELEHDPRVAVVLQGRRGFVSLSGHARVVHDRALLRRLWSPDWRAWFPGGAADPRLCVIAVEPEEAEFWDRSRGLRRLLQLGASTPRSDTAVDGVKVHLA